MDSQVSRVTLSVYKGEDFQLWVEETKLNLMSLNLWRLVQGNEKPPDDESQNDRWQARCDTAYALICKSLSPTYRECLKEMSNEDPVEAWKRVIASNNKTTANTESALLRKLLRMKCPEERTSKYTWVTSVM